jgi:hypothetical protein
MGIFGDFLKIIPSINAGSRVGAIYSFITAENIIDLVSSMERDFNEGYSMISFSGFSMIFSSGSSMRFFSAS